MLFLLISSFKNEKGTGREGNKRKLYERKEKEKKLKRIKDFDV